MSKNQGVVHKHINEVVRQPLCEECLPACLPNMASLMVFNEFYIHFRSTEDTFLIIYVHHNIFWLVAVSVGGGAGGGVIWCPPL